MSSCRDERRKKWTRVSEHRVGPAGWFYLVTTTSESTAAEDGGGDGLSPLVDEQELHTPYPNTARNRPAQNPRQNPLRISSQSLPRSIVHTPAMDSSEGATGLFARLFPFSHERPIGRLVVDGVMFNGYKFMPGCFTPGRHILLDTLVA